MKALVVVDFISTLYNNKKGTDQEMVLLLDTNCKPLKDSNSWCSDTNDPGPFNLSQTTRFSKEILGITLTKESHFAIKQAGICLHYILLQLDWHRLVAGIYTDQEYDAYIQMVQMNGKSLEGAFKCKKTPSATYESHCRIYLRICIEMGTFKNTTGDECLEHFKSLVKEFSQSSMQESKATVEESLEFLLPFLTRDKIIQTRVWRRIHSLFYPDVEHADSVQWDPYASIFSKCSHTIFNDLIQRSKLQLLYSTPQQTPLHLPTNSSTEKMKSANGNIATPSSTDNANTDNLDYIRLQAVLSIISQTRLEIKHASFNHAP
ncbi:uncharacterized protein BdWA1_003873 [Babesia duncani]|uniref:Uncharacterized protein n=1 Tax=Babesia duncani TaxID=323732 RepID=A0AAD9UMH0_9APIC|nr:hypothetical protein BdWA1_003873 [Babesia duncani]